MRFPLCSIIFQAQPHRGSILAARRPRQDSDRPCRLSPVAAPLLPLARSCTLTLNRSLLISSVVSARLSRLPRHRQAQAAMRYRQSTQISWRGIRLIRAGAERHQPCPGPATGTGHHGAAGAGRLVVTAARAVTTRRPWSPDPCSARSASRPTRPGRAGSATAHSTNTRPPVPNCSPTRVPQLNGAPGHADRHRRRSRPARRPKPLDTRSNRVRANHQQRCRRGAYTGRATSDHNRGLADIPLKFLTAASASRPAVPHDRSRTSRVDSLRDTAPAVASRPRDPGCPAARPSFGHTSTFTRDNSA
jgi:hypothetical protein